MTCGSAFAAALDLIDDANGPVVFVFEDLHWADEATLDLFTFLARRLDSRAALLLATFRSDEVDDRHPLRVRLGDVHAHIRARLVAAIADVTEDEFVDGLETCCALGLLERQADGTLRFRHELGRLAIERSLSERQARAHHAAALAALRTSPDRADLARLAHRAEGAGDGPAVVDLAPRAAGDAAAAGSHREAATLLESALRYAHLCEGSEQGALLMRLADAERSLGRFEAVGLLGRPAEGITYLDRAGELLGDDPAPSRARARVEAAWCSELVRLHQCRDRRAALHQRAHRRSSRLTDPVEARRVDQGRGGDRRGPPRPRLTARVGGDG